MHRDLFYRNDFFTRLAESLAESLINKITDGFTEEKLKKLILEEIDAMPKKIDGTAYIKRGGNGNNSANMIAKLGIPTGLLTVIGSDCRWMIDELKELGMDTSAVFVKDETTPISTIIEDPAVTKIFVASNLKSKMNTEGVEIKKDIFDNIGYIFFTPMDFKYKEIYDMAADTDVIKLFTLELQKIKTYKELSECVNRPSDYMFCNLGDAYTVCNKLIDFEFSPSSEKEAEAAIEKIDPFFEKFADVRIYTLGKYGSWAVFGEKIVHRGVYPVKVINRTGAGDTFAAAFIASLYNENITEKPAGLGKERLKEITEKALEFASAASAYKVSTGNAPTLSDIKEITEKYT